MIDLPIISYRKNSNWLMPNTGHSFVRLRNVIFTMRDAYASSADCVHARERPFCTHLFLALMILIASFHNLFGIVRIVGLSDTWTRKHADLVLWTCAIPPMLTWFSLNLNATSSWFPNAEPSGFLFFFRFFFTFFLFSIARYVDTLWHEPVTVSRNFVKSSSLIVYDFYEKFGSFLWVLIRAKELRRSKRV